MRDTLRFMTFALCGIASDARSADAPALEAHTVTLTRLACEAGRAYAARDLDVLDTLTADDYTHTDVRGVILKRADWREFVRNRKSVLTVECDNVEVRFYGDVAVVAGGWTYTNHKADGNVTTNSRWISVWTKERTGWKRHAFQNTYVNPQADRCATDPQP